MALTEPLAWWASCRGMGAWTGRAYPSASYSPGGVGGLLTAPAGPGYSS